MNQEEKDFIAKMCKVTELRQAVELKKRIQENIDILVDELAEMGVYYYLDSNRMKILN